ncbi:amino acid/polyamine/organocation transporter, APC superfamily (TC 2.A.3) [Geodermatophilus obscurus]|uniref:Amino acid/polyamine/organocation transporter, APC superfamily (TC 2.A.3) n=1 Tax=Geodermatophilus obscurus TaxID=1861 RepID=A0A1M7UY09_9ACTN|nr:APC family permease [Geodermatophilus obscurus]SHN87873.1 amino acid/polyamine/organocation transporter, APC superfamily (TC 2.A.3) [Geodermatophilus obscurus]
MAETSTGTVDDEDSGLRRSITAKQLFFYTLGDVLGSGIYVLIGLVAAAVGGAFWIAFALGVTVAAITGAAYAELVTKYPQAAGAALYVKKAFGSTALTFLVTVSFLSASFAATGSLATGFASYFATLWEGPPALLVSLVFVLALVVVNFIGITESVVMNMVMTFVEISGLVIVMVIGVWYIAQGDADFGVLADISVSGNPALAVLAGIAYSFFAMTGFENTANVAEETIDPHRAFPRSLVGGMVVAGTVYVLVSMAAALTVPVDQLASSDAALLEVVRQGILPFSTDFMTTLFSIIALIAITNTTLVTIVTQPRILYGMAKEDVVPGVFAKIHATRRSPWVGLLFSAAVVAALLITGTIVLEAGGGIDLVNRLALVTVVLLLAIYALVIVACLKLRGQDENEHTFRANTPLLIVGLVGNLAILGFSIYDDPTSLIWCAALIAIGVVLFLVEYAAGSRNRPPGTRRGDPEAASRRDA